MVPQDFKDNKKKSQIMVTLEVLANVVKNGTASDANLDVTRSSSLPTLLISIVRAIVKAPDVRVPDLLAELLHNISLLCKNSFSKAVGIESIYMKAFIPLLPTLIRDDNVALKVATLKAIGTFASLAVIIPIRCQNFFKDILENGLVSELCDLLLRFDCSLPKNVTPVNSLTLEVVSTLMCPVYGDFYSFPWKRGPHDNILDYTEAKNIFEKVRQQIMEALLMDK